MDRETESLLLDFCVRQRVQFNLDAWFALPVPVGNVATVTLFLAGVDWYGHQADLLSVAERLWPGSPGNFSVLAKEMQFDCSRFSGMLKMMLEQHENASQRRRSLQ